jgi:proline iminopeptidase
MIVSVNGAELFYAKHGQGPACLVLSGMGAKPYERLTAALRSHMSVVHVDLRGSGLSTGQPTDLSFDVLADDLEAIRAELGVDRIGVLGHSILGMLAIEYGRRRPDNVSHVIVAGTPPRGDMTWVTARATTFFEENASDDRKTVLRDNLAKLQSGASFMERVLAQTPLRFFDARLDAAPLFADRVADPRLLMHVIGTLAPTWDITEGSSSLRVAVLIAHGRHDYTVPWVLWDGIPQRLPNATLHVLEQSGHHPFYEESERFVAALTEWLAKLP